MPAARVPGVAAGQAALGGLRGKRAAPPSRDGLSAGPGPRIPVSRSICQRLGVTACRAALRLVAWGRGPRG